MNLSLVILQHLFCEDKERLEKGISIKTWKVGLYKLRATTNFKSNREFGSKGIVPKSDYQRYASSSMLPGVCSQRNTRRILSRVYFQKYANKSMQWSFANRSVPGEYY